jgi:hypothetical protein
VPGINNSGKYLITLKITTTHWLEFLSKLYYMRRIGLLHILPEILNESIKVLQYCTVSWTIIGMKEMNWKESY